MLDNSSLNTFISVKKYFLQVSNSSRISYDKIYNLLIFKIEWFIRQPFVQVVVTVDNRYQNFHGIQVWDDFAQTCSEIKLCDKIN